MFRLVFYFPTLSVTGNKNIGIVYLCLWRVFETYHHFLYLPKQTVALKLHFTVQYKKFRARVSTIKTYVVA